MFGVPIWFAEQNFIEGEEDDNLIIFEADLIFKTKKAALLKIGPEGFKEEIWVPLSLLEELS
jgi:hypothetical protein